MIVVVMNPCYFITRKYKVMQIDDFLLEKEPIDKLVSSYLEIENSYDKTIRANNQKKETLLLNSILVALATKQSTTKQFWSETKYCLEINNGNRDCLRRGAILLIEVFKRNPQSLQAAPKDVILDIIGQSCEKAFITICGNEYIELIDHLTSKLGLASDLQEALPTIITMVASNKLQVNTYRQETRLSLYRILLRLLDLQKEKSSLLQKCVRAGEGQKDPRNIGIVFELYLKILSIFPAQKLVQYRAAMFQNIQSYYPIEFVGDEDDKEHRKVNFRQISSLLDQCLCHPFFSELTWQLLSSKTAAPPLAPFISTLLAYFRSLRFNPNPTLNARLASLLFRFSQEEFIDEEYEEHANQNLSTVVQGLLDVIFCKEDGSFTIEAYATVKKWLDLMLSKVTVGECHHSGTMMGLFRAIINRVNTPRFRALIELVRSLSLKAILRTISDGEVIPKLGLAVIVVTDADRVSDDFEELIGLLVLKIGSLYSTVSDEVKLLLLKTLMEVYKGAERNQAMVRKVNDGFILKDILSRAQAAFSSNPNPNQAYLVKAFIDFVATVHAHEIDQLLEQVTGLNFELQGYLLGRLWENSQDNGENLSAKVKIIQKLNLLIQRISKNYQGDDLVKGLKVINKSLLLKIVLAANWQRPSQYRQFVFSILLALRKQLQTSDIQRTYIKPQALSYSLSSIIAQFFLHNNQEGLPLSKEQQLWRALGDQEENQITFPLMSQIGKYDVYSPFMENLILAYPPTFIQWTWEELKTRQDSETKSKKLGEILKWLPQPLLLRDRKEVLGLILNNGKCAPSLLKIAKHIEIDTIKSSGIVQYCLQYAHSLLEGENPENTTQRTTCILATLISVAQRDEKGEIKQAIRQSERTLRELKQHRKRPVRQAMRRLLALLQE